jgi:hypothetical protein
MNIPSKLLLTIIFSAMELLIYSQTEEYYGEPPTLITKKNVYEMEFQFPVMVGFSYFHNFGNKFVPGIGAKSGAGVLYCVNLYRCGSDFTYANGFLAEVLDIDLKARDLFSKQKLSRRYSYDFGINYTIILWEDWMHYLSAKFAFNVKVLKAIRLGLSIKVGDDLLNNDIGFWIFLNPSIVISL